MHKIERAVKYRERGVIGGESRINPKELRRTMEAAYIPVYEDIPKPSRKRKHGRRHSP